MLGADYAKLGHEVAELEAAGVEAHLAGQVKRRGLLEQAGIRLPDDLGPAGVAAADDTLS